MEFGSHVKTTAYKSSVMETRQNRDKLLAHSKRNPVSACLEWTGTKTEFGYGVVTINGSQRRAHRVAYETWVGAIPDGKIVCHKCDNPACISPEHLFLGSHRDNAADRNSKGRQAIGERHGRWKGGNSYNYIARTVPKEEREALKAAKKKKRERLQREAKARAVIDRVEARRKAR